MKKLLTAKYEVIFMHTVVKKYINVELDSKYNKYIKERNLLHMFKLCLDRKE